MAGPVAEAYGKKDHLEEAFRGVVNGMEGDKHLFAAYRNFHWLSADSDGQAALDVALSLIITLTKKGVLTADEAVEILTERR